MMLIGVVFVLLTGFHSTLANAEDSTPVASNAESTSKHVVTFTRDRDYACLQCHKDDENPLKGKHATAINPHNSREVGCVDCHGKIAPDHRDRASKVNVLKPAQTQAGTNKLIQSSEKIFKQNEQCVACHEPKELQKVNWTHDVHAKQLTCSSCHNIHASVDPMQDIKRKDKIQMCVDCHSDQREVAEQSKANKGGQ